ncbi:membrane protein [Chryseotalea sanaruensis]|uniref:Membrane protein n=1 Tax=Chryseotalea sanaruensis TaxID=2482724 RepID=A0A401U950_9BACT|nr:cation transporter [Chryseotalea sanaruensis]GCC51394.1 membrane protein [Chryseotalea sanaruensis]
MVQSERLTQQDQLYRLALALAIFTVAYNLAEGIIATIVGFEDETIALFGFGLDSFIEMISGIGIAHMIFRLNRNPMHKRDTFERNALRITGYSFYLLTAGLVLGAILVTYIGKKPQTTFWGIVISIVSILIMLALLYGKLHVGKKLNSDAIIADANCTRICIYMSLILLTSSAVYHFTDFSYIDAIGTLGLAWFAFKEGKECFEKANSDKYCTCD